MWVARSSTAGNRAGLVGTAWGLMFLAFEDRPSDSPVIDRVWRSHSERAGTFRSMAASYCGIVVSRCRGETVLTVRGPETKPSLAECPGEGEWTGVCFKLGAFLPLFPAAALRDRQDANLPQASSRSFWLNGSAWEYPNFENIETFVARLVQRGLIVVDPTVAAAQRGEGMGRTKRTQQRRFLAATGITQTTIRQIERARQATRLLQQGVGVLDVVAAAGYFDQAHLTHALQRLVGLTPGQIARGEEQLSLLYNTDGS